LWLLVSAHFTNAQEPKPAARGLQPEVRAGIGLAYLDFNLAPAARQGLAELESKISMDLLPGFGAEIEVGYLRTSNVLGSGRHSDRLSYLAGPVWYPSKWRFHPYVHGLVGLARITGPIPVAPNQFDYGMVNKLAWQLGAGVELHVHGPIRLKIGTDYLHSAFFGPLLDIRGQHDVRILVSIECVFGIHRKR
jgi:hypothetical protein